MNYSISIYVPQQTEWPNSNRSPVIDFVLGFPFDHNSFNEEDGIDVNRSIFSGGQHFVRVSAKCPQKLVSVFAATGLVLGYMPYEIDRLVSNFYSNSKLKRSHKVRYDHRPVKDDHSKEWNFRKPTPHYSYSDIVPAGENYTYIGPLASIVVPMKTVSEKEADLIVTLQGIQAEEKVLALPFKVADLPKVNEAETLTDDKSLELVMSKLPEDNVKRAIQTLCIFDHYGLLYGSFLDPLNDTWKVKCIHSV